jgi:hypothetical protein
VAVPRTEALLYFVLFPGNLAHPTSSNSLYAADSNLCLQSLFLLWCTDLIFNWPKYLLSSLLVFLWASQHLHEHPELHPSAVSCPQHHS